jgi:hypothetical protein
MVVTIAGASAPSSKRHRQAVVVCFNGPSPPGQFSAPVFRTKPRKCRFVNRRVPFPPTYFGYVEMRRIHWSGWSHLHARGKGSHPEQMSPHPVPLKVSLYRPLDRCGRRVFSEARFVAKDGRSSTVPLITCP